MTMSKGNISVLIVDDHPFVREGLRSFLNETPDCTVVGEASSGEEALRLVQRLKPNFILLDINLPGANGLEIVGQLRRLAPQAKILVLTVHNSREYMLHVSRSGAHGYILKEAPPMELLRAMRVIQAGETYFVPNLSVDKDAPALTPREVEVLILTAKGKGIKEIASALSITNATVQTYRVRIMQKLKVHHVAGLVKFAIQKGYVSLE
jgi:DNA-binding NarL/FixJ family response regulator